MFDEELSFVWNSLRRFGVRDADLEDVGHEVFLVVHRRLGEYDPNRPIRPWLFAIAFRCASDFRRRAHHRSEVLTEGRDPSDPAERADDTLVAVEEKNLARRALLLVPEDRRAIVILHDFESVAMQDVADAMSIPLKTAYSRLRIGREELVTAAKRLQKVTK